MNARSTYSICLWAQNSIKKWLRWHGREQHCHFTSQCARGFFFLEIDKLEDIFLLKFRYATSCMTSYVIWWFCVITSSHGAHIGFMYLLQCLQRFLFTDNEHEFIPHLIINYSPGFYSFHKKTLRLFRYPLYEFVMIRWTRHSNENFTYSICHCCYSVIRRFRRQYKVK